MVARHFRMTVVRRVVAGLLLIGVGVAPALLAPGVVTWPFVASGGPARGYEKAASVLMTVAAGGGAGVFLWGMLLVVRPGWHPLYRRLAPFGPPREVAAEIGAELARDDEVVRVGEPAQSPRRASNLYGEVILTRSWVLQPTDFGPRVARLDDVVWVRKVVFHAADPRGGAFGAVAFGVEVKVRRGSDETFLTGRDDADRLLAELLRRLPWVLSGVDSRWDELWQRDRGRLFESVQAQREQVQAGGPAGREALAADKLRMALAQARTVEGVGLWELRS